MKKLTLFLLLAFFAGVTQIFAKQYCDYPISTEDVDVTVSYYHVSGNEYGIIIKAVGNLIFTGRGVCTVSVNQTKGAAINVNSVKWTVTEKEAYAYFNTNEGSVPTDMVNNSVAFRKDKNTGKSTNVNISFTLPTEDIDWSATCGGEGGNTGGGTGGEGTTVTAASCSGHGNGVDEFYSSHDPLHAIQSLTKGFDWVISNDVNGNVSIAVTIQDALPGMAAPCIFFFDGAGVLKGDPINNISWNATKREASYTLKAQKEGVQISFLIKLALEAGGVLFTERMSYTVGQSCESAQTGFVQKSEIKNNRVKFIKNGQLVVEHNGRCYNTLGSLIH